MTEYAIYEGRILCLPCWNYDHFGHNPQTKKKVSHCLKGKCECLCTQELLVKKRVKKDKSLQLKIADTYGSMEIK